MKAVIYHADAKFAWGDPVGNIYERLFEAFKKRAKRYGISVVHLTLGGLPGWGDENHFYKNLDAKNVVLNREECFTQFLETAPDDVYWFCEPDIEIYKMWPELKADCAMLYRHKDDVPMCPAWRMATPKAYPFFRRLRDQLRDVKERPGVGFDWHGDSEAFTKVWQEMGRPTTNTVFMGLNIEFRKYEDYIKGNNTYSRNYFGKRKLEMLK